MSDFDVKEKRFEEDIEDYLTHHGGYTKGDPKKFNRESGLEEDTFVEFIKTSQPKKWERYVKIYAENSEKQIIERFKREVKTTNLLNVMRHGFMDRGIKFYPIFWKPETSLNETTQMQYDANILHCTRQLHYSVHNENSIDIVLFANGIPVVSIDESWLDVTASTSIKGDGMKIAKEISSRIKYELGVTVSIGVSWNKIFAKLGSDYKKPDAITEFSKDNYKDIAWKLPVGDLLMVGRSTERTMKKLGICTIGDLAGAEPSILETYLGKMGLVLHTFANGWDKTPVSVEGYRAPIKSIGNSTTTPRDLVSELDVKIILMALSESVGARLRENGFQCRTVEISIRDNGLYHFTRQCKLDRASNLTEEIARTAFELFQKNYNWEHPIRSLGVRGCDLVSEEMPYQLDLFMDETKREKIKKMDQVADEIRGRFGYQSIQRAFMYQDKILAQLNAKEHTVHPQAYFHG